MSTYTAHLLRELADSRLQRLQMLADNAALVDDTLNLQARMEADRLCRAVFDEEIMALYRVGLSKPGFVSYARVDLVGIRSTLLHLGHILAPLAPPIIPQDPTHDINSHYCTSLGGDSALLMWKDLV